MILILLIIIHKIKIYYLIECNADYYKILKESQILDKYIIEMYRK